MPHSRPRAMPFAALLISLALAWLNFTLTGKWADLPGALNGARWPIYGAALASASVLLFVDRRTLGTRADPGRAFAWLTGIAGWCTLIAALLTRLPLRMWGDLVFQDDWTELYQQTVNGVHLLQRGSVVGWNWGLQSGYPTSTDIAQNFAAIALVPMTLFGDRVGYHVLHAAVFLALPAIVWWDVRHEDRRAAAIAGGLAAFFVAGFFVSIVNSGDTNSLMGVFCATLALAASRAARLGRRWGGPLLLFALTLALYTHQAFFVYALILLTFEAAYFQDRRAFVRLLIAAGCAAVAALPMHWESLRYHAYVSFNNTVYDPAAPKDWGLAARTVYYNIEVLAFPHRWFNDYRSLTNVWLPVLVAGALVRERSRGGFYAGATVIAQLLLRFNTSEAGAIFDRIQHLLPVLAAPALAAFVLRVAGTRRLAAALLTVMATYVATSFVPVGHVPELRAWNPPLIDHIAAATTGNAIVVEINPHRDMDADPVRRTPTTPFGVHYEGLLPSLAGQRFYSQMIDGWVWNRWRGEVVAAGTWMGHAIDEAPVDTFVSEMNRWGVRDLFVWSDGSRAYLAGSGRFIETWRDGRWSSFALRDADARQVVVPHGEGTLAALDFLGGEVRLDGVTAGDPVVVRTHFYPAWRARSNGREVPLYDADGQLAFHAPQGGRYTVTLEYPRYHLLSALSFAVFLAGALFIQSRRVRNAAPSSY